MATRLRPPIRLRRARRGPLAPPPPPRRPRRAGQNTVEYLLMLTVVVGVVLLAGMAMKRYFPGLIESIKGMISGTADHLGR